jgi:hypothetical protein
MSVPMQDENLVLHCASTDLDAACDSWFPLVFTATISHVK